MPGKGWFVILRLCSPLEPISPKLGARARSNWFGEASQQAVNRSIRQPQEVCCLSEQNQSIAPTVGVR